MVIAKGIDELATKIREIAAENKIVIMEVPPLARALYQHTELGDEIPAPLYSAVAQVLASNYVAGILRVKSNPYIPIL